MSEGREPTFICAAGQPRVGKTFANMETAKRELTKKNPRKVLIVDSQDEYNLDNMDIRKIQLYAKPIHISQVAKFSSSKFVECCRIRPFNDNGLPMSLSDMARALDVVMNTYRNGLLVVEDFKRFAGSSMKQELVDKLCTRGHSGTDTLVSLQGVGQITPIMWQNLKYLRLHKTTDSVERHYGKFPEKIQYLTIAQTILDKKYFDGDYRFRLMIDLENGYIHGKYSQAEFIDAAKKFIFNNWKDTAGKLMNYRNDEGKKQYTDATAIQQVLYEFTHAYSQFSPRLNDKKK